MKKLVLKKSTVSEAGRVYRINYQEQLNTEQLEAVMHQNGPALVLAGAGTGKTRTLTYRVARMVEDGIDPTSILLLTFTRKASSEMLHRAGALLDGRCSRVSGGTFHSVGYALLRRYGKLLTSEFGLKSVSVLDQADSEDALNLVRSRYDVSRSNRRFARASTIAAMVSKAVNTMQPLSEIIQKEYHTYASDTELLLDIARGYQEYKRQHGLIDYDDLLLLQLSMTRHPQISELLKKQYQHVMVDEYQDVNALQHAIIMGLCGRNGNVLAVGDDAQSIYAFRGADIRNIHAFPESFERCAVIRLEQNYRSTQPILDVCNTIMDDAPRMFRKQLHSNRQDGELPIIVACNSERQQSEFIVQQLLELTEQGAELAKCAVLIRSGFLSFDLEIALDKARIPFRKVGGLRFTETAHVKDLLALLRITENPRDAIAWYRSLLLLQGVGAKIAQSFVDSIPAIGNPLESPIPSIPGKAGIAVNGMCAVLRRAVASQSSEVKIRGLADWYRTILERKYDDAQRRFKDLEIIIGICSGYRSISQFLADIAIDPPKKSLAEGSANADHDEEVLTISTIHSAKGLEWETVFVISVNEGYLPSGRSSNNEDAIEEERRLLYVACTRAKDKLILSYPSVVQEREYSEVLGRPSRFLDTINAGMCPQYHLEDASDSE